MSNELLWFRLVRVADLKPDVPIERDSISAMGVALGSEVEPHPFRAYVYRGTGEDQLPDFIEEDRRRRRREVARIKTTAKRERERKQLEARNYISPDWRPSPGVAEFNTHEAPRVEVLYPKRRIPTPSPGWKPMTGADIEALLEEMEET